MDIKSKIKDKTMLLIKVAKIKTEVEVDVYRGHKLNKTIKEEVLSELTFIELALIQEIIEMAELTHAQKLLACALY